MKINIIWRTLLLVNIFSIIHSDDNVCTPNTDCGSCLRSSGSCSWCKDENFTSTVQQPRCDLPSNLKDCKDIMNVQGEVKVVTNDATLQVRPKEVKLKLRPGAPKTFSIKVTPAKNFPVNLYYLMDMSKSMEDDLEKLQSLGTKIAAEIGTITTKYKLGFGSFVDKTVAPFIQVNKKDRPCTRANDKNGNFQGFCVPTFGYRHVFNFSKDAQAFEAAVKKQIISGNLDTPEGGMDGLMQVATCEKILQWPEKDRARRLVVFVTDALPHISGDGKLGGIVIPNDGECHLDAQGRYTESNTMDYPSLSQVRAKLKENKIIPIFAVTGDVVDTYNKISNQWKDIGSSIGELSGNSDNIVNLIRDSYKAILQTVRLSNDPVDNIRVEYKPKVCDSPDGDDTCTDVKIEQEVEFSVTLTATQCPIDLSKKGDRTFNINIPGFGEVKVDVELICQCPCETLPNMREENSVKCNGTGTFQCGICYCPEGRYGEQCQCDGFTKLSDKECKPNNTTETVCSGMGNCVCGKCVCHRQDIPTNIVSGKYCQCTNFGCDYHKGEVCGGADRGICVCNKCVCNEPFIGQNCGEVNCTIADKQCSDKNGVECSGKGECNCGICNCNGGYEGKHCEKCIACPEKCDNHAACVLYQAFQKCIKDDCSDCSLNIKFVNETEPNCVYNDDGCLTVFNFEKNFGSENETVLVVKERKCSQKLTEETKILVIVLGTIAGIVLVGLLLLIIWKLVVTGFDKYEYHKFENDRMKSKWEKAENPIYKGAKQEYQNPTYAGHK
ncbi:integrin beta-1-like [Clytia hemisphaerica]|uniref:Integrin beta n=1 Tax=Clytia hemisphaerica TaxID=252671 RepID=A0A7M5UH92_9CNID